MRLLEYEAKTLLAAHGAPIPHGQLVTTADQHPALPFPVVLKVQIPIGGRGKAGGVKPVYTQSEFHDTVKQFLAEPLLGYRVTSVLAEQTLEISREMYLAIAFDRAARGLVILAHKNGGVDIEAAAQADEMFKLPIDGEPTDAQQQAVLEHLGLIETLRAPLETLVNRLWSTCVHEDALLVEINPLVLTADDHLICADAKIELDDAAAFRHEWDFQQSPASTQFVVLNEQGTVGSMANGAGLAMATVDAIQAGGGEPANFFDVGGGTNALAIAQSFGKISALPQVRAIVVNIFGGITRCDEVAEAILMARNSVSNLPPLFIRLTGTNEAKGKEILENAGIHTLPDLKSCVAAALQEVRRV